MTWVRLGALSGHVATSRRHFFLSIFDADVSELPIDRGTLTYTVSVKANLRNPFDFSGATTLPFFGNQKMNETKLVNESNSSDEEAFHGRTSPKNNGRVCFYLVALFLLQSAVPIGYCFRHFFFSFDNIAVKVILNTENSYVNNYQKMSFFFLCTE